MSEMRECSVEDGRVFAANNGKRVKIAGREAIILHNHWVDQSEGEHHQVGLDFRSDPSFARGDASPECQRLVLDVFSDLVEPPEWQVTEEYVASLPEIYRDILGVYPKVEPNRRAGDCLAFQTLYSALHGKYELGEIRTACERMADARAMVIRARQFACPTRLGEDIISVLTGMHASQRAEVPPFSPPPAMR